MPSNLSEEVQQLRQACANVKSLLDRAANEIREILGDDFILNETPMEAQAVYWSTADLIADACECLARVNRPEKPTVPLPNGSRNGPTRKQGQFLAFIRDYMMWNNAGQAPSHADLQRFFNLTPPSVNSMLIRLEERGFIRREPGKARAIEIVIDPELIPPLDRSFKV